MFTNKHVIVAMLLAPLLAILAWFGVGYLTAEKPHVAQPGASYPLVEKSNCRYDSGVCDLQNEDFALVLSLSREAGRPVLTVNASHPLDAVLLAVAEHEDGVRPEPMRESSGDGREWELALDEVPGPDQRIRLVASAADTRYFAESGTAFLERYRGK